MPTEKRQTRLQQTPQQPKSMCKHRQRLLKNAGLRAQRLPAAPACTLGAPHDSESYLHLHLQFLPPAWQIAVQNLPALAGATAATCMTCCRADHQCLCPGQYHPHATLRQPEAEDRLPSSAASGNTRLRQGCGGVRYASALETRSSSLIRPMTKSHFKTTAAWRRNLKIARAVHSTRLSSILLEKECGLQLVSKQAS